MEKNLEASDFLIQYNDSLENFNIGQEILITDENVAEPNEYVCEGNNSEKVVTIPCPIYDENQQPGLFEMPSASEFVPISVTPIHVQEIPKMFINNDIHQKLTLALDAGAAHTDSNIKPENDSDVGANVVPNEIVVTEEQYGLLKDRGWMLLEIKGYTRKIKQEPIPDSNNEPPRSSMEVDVKPITEKANTNTVPKTKTSRNMEDMEQVKKKKKPRQAKPTKCGIKPRDLTGAGFPSGSGNGPRETFIKCPYELKDIPKEIVLGKTANGKKLVARVRHVNPKNTTGNKDGNTNV